ncbi:MAG: cell division protein FtsQ, partial [Rhodothermales bacterium]
MKGTVAFFGTMAVAVLLGYMGWRWLDAVVVEAITVRGAVHADSTAIVQLTGIELGSPMKAVSAELVADRVRRHPWVQGASVSRQPTGSVLISIRERVPVV